MSSWKGSQSIVSISTSFIHSAGLRLQWGSVTMWCSSLYSWHWAADKVPNIFLQLEKSNVHFPALSYWNVHLYVTVLLKLLMPTYFIVIKYIQHKIYHFKHFWKDFTYVLLERGDRRERGRETSMCGCLPHAPYWGPGQQPRHVPWLGIKLAILWFASTQSFEPNQPGPPSNIFKCSIQWHLSIHKHHCATMHLQNCFHIPKLGLHTH